MSSIPVAHYPCLQHRWKSSWEDLKFVSVKLELCPVLYILSVHTHIDIHTPFLSTTPLRLNEFIFLSLVIMLFDFFMEYWVMFSLRGAFFFYYSPCIGEPTVPIYIYSHCLDPPASHHLSNCSSTSSTRIRISS